MKNRCATTWMILTLGLGACTEERASLEPDGSFGGPDGSAVDRPLLDGAQVDGAQVDAGPEPDGSPWLDASAPDAAVYVPPAVPTTFRLSLGQSRCLGDCPAFHVAVDQDGKVEYEGRACTRRPGVFAKQVPAADARALYDAFVAADFWGYRATYTSVADGCTDVLVDGPSSTWSAVTDGHVQTVQRNEGCQGVPSLARLDALAQTLRQLTASDAWIAPAPFNCGAGYIYPFQIGESYTVATSMQTLGLLKLPSSKRSWELVDCAGASLAVGEVAEEPTRLILHRASTSLVLPLDAGEVGSIVVEHEGDAGVGAPADAGLRATGLRTSEDLTLTLTPATGC